MDLFDFKIFGYSAIIIWIIGSTLGIVKKSNKIILFSGILGNLIIAIFILSYWNYIERPPFRTLAETRLWYSFFLALIGNLIFIKWKLKWFPIYTFAMASLFILINIYNPETYNKSLMPALQSVWFIPHVIVYMIAYAFLTVSFIVAVRGILKPNEIDKYTALADNIVYIGFGFLTLGLLFGALWAKKAWGHYWTWDPKETWAFITWCAYLIYIHFKPKLKSDKYSLYILIFAFVLLITCWFGVQFLASAQNSVHIYAY
jgi:ABC-type transport system involved in cytochrome c biogenesis permease subunit